MHVKDFEKVVRKEFPAATMQRMVLRSRTWIDQGGTGPRTYNEVQSKKIKRQHTLANCIIMFVYPSMYFDKYWYQVKLVPYLLTKYTTHPFEELEVFRKEHAIGGMAVQSILLSGMANWVWFENEADAVTYRMRK